MMIYVLLEYLLVEIKLSDKSAMPCDVSNDLWITIIGLIISLYGFRSSNILSSDRALTVIS
jgi:hypothetical protein